MMGTLSAALVGSLRVFVYCVNPTLAQAPKQKEADRYQRTAYHQQSTQFGAVANTFIIYAPNTCTVL